MNKYFKRRTRVTALAVLLLMSLGLFTFRLFSIQIISHDDYVTLAYKEQVKKLVIPAKRGAIYALDRGKPSPMVLNTTVYTMFVDPMVIKNPADIKRVLNKYALENIYQPDKIDEKLAYTSSRYQVLATDLTRQQAEQIKAEKLFGVGFQAVSKRVYPEGVLAAQVLGFVNAEGGQYGVEGGLHNRLSGKDGLLESVTDVSQVPLSIGEQYTHVPAQDGENIVLTIDKNIQAFAEQVISESAQANRYDQVSMIIMRPDTGEVMAMANYPSYNPTEYSKVADATLFNNRITMVPYEPGSVMKTFTVAMGLDKNIITPATTFYNSDRVKVADRMIVNAVKGHTGTVTMQDAMRYSMNTGMVEILVRAGGGQINSKSINLFYDYLHNHFRFGQRTGIEVPETKGLLVPPTSQEGNAVRYANMSFGQGYNPTMLQVATAFSALINGGKYHRPTLVSGVVDSGGKFIRSEKTSFDQVVRPETSTTLREMIIKTRAGDSTGLNDPKGFEVGGKTGTSETIEDGKYIKTQTIASYLGYGGGEYPEYVIMVQVGAKGRYLVGGIDAAPIFSRMSNWLLEYLRIQPKE